MIYTNSQQDREEKTYAKRGFLYSVHPGFYGQMAICFGDVHEPNCRDRVTVPRGLGTVLGHSFNLVYRAFVTLVQRNGERKNVISMREF